ncbi:MULTISPECIES: hypothetical protein [Nostocales]
MAKARLKQLLKFYIKEPRANQLYFFGYQPLLHGAKKSLVEYGFG